MSDATMAGDFGRVDPVMRTRQEPAQHPQLGQNFHGRGVHGVAAKIAQEITVFFQDQHVDPGAGEQQASQHSGWPAAHDYHIGGTSHRVGRIRPPGSDLNLAPPSGPIHYLRWFPRGS